MSGHGRTSAASEEHDSAKDGADEPEADIEEVYPDGVLHALDIGIAIGVCVEVDLGEGAEDGDPEDASHGC
jgi:hypothetical protein